jgi:hypothetical protein
MSVTLTRLLTSSESYPKPKLNSCLHKRLLEWLNSRRINSLMMKIGIRDLAQTKKLQFRLWSGRSALTRR